MRIFNGKKIVLGVTGSIAAYKSASLASELIQSGAEVQVVMTTAATHFVGPLSFESLTHCPVVQDVLALGRESEIAHVTVAKQAALVIIAPATANTIAKLAHGLADDAVSAISLATRAPIVIAPAMETGMWENQATQDNLRLLRGRGFVVVEPVSGHLASGGEGVGRLANADAILAAARTALARDGSLSGRRMVITSGGTREAIDPVRVITNRSSGRMGFALAEEALGRGARVSFISTSEAGDAPIGAEVTYVDTTEEMCAAVLQTALGADALIMSAAPGDFRIVDPARAKIKKEKSETFSVELTRNADILESVARLREQEPALAPKVVVGFAAETEDLLKNARRKLEAKHLDLIIANPVPQTFGSDQVKASVLASSGEVVDMELMSKERLAEVIFDRIEGLVIK